MHVIFDLNLIIYYARDIAKASKIYYTYVLYSIVDYTISTSVCIVMLIPTYVHE